MTFGLAGLICRRNYRNFQEWFALNDFILRASDRKLNGSYFIITCVFRHYDLTSFSVPTLWSKFDIHDLFSKVTIDLRCYRKGLVMQTSILDFLRYPLLLLTLRLNKVLIATSLLFIYLTVTSQALLSFNRY